MFTIPKKRCLSGALARMLILFSLLAISPVAASAQEDRVGAPPPLQWPVLERDPRANRSVPISLVRQQIEDGANGELCKNLLKDNNLPIPDDFEYIRDCPQKYKDAIKDRLGNVRWALGAKPTECGTDCVGRPSMTSSTFLDRPNTIFAALPGHLDFRVLVKLPYLPNVWRTVRYNYEAQFHCVTQGKREGNLTIRVVFDRPFPLESGPLEDILNVLVAPVNLTHSVEAGLRRKLSTPGSQSQTLGRCSSIGYNKAGIPADDNIIYNEPQPGTGPLPGTVRDTVQNRRTATVRFLRVTRKLVFGYSPPPETGQFLVFLNGIQGIFPDPPGIKLPPAGGSAEINLCKTIDMNGPDRLQLIFFNSHGGAVWSQFGPNTKFGAGPQRTMTTLRRVPVPGQPGPPDPTTGKPPGGSKPQILQLREFELLYTIEFHAPPDEANRPRPVTGGVVRPPSSSQGSDVRIITPSGGQPARPCQKI